MTTSELGPVSDNKCDNCGEQLLGDYCWVCGQKDTHYNRSVFKVVGDFFKEMFDVDSRVFTTLSTLFFRPGALSVQFRDNKRATYVRPIRLYLFSSLVFFFLVAIITQSASRVMSTETGEDESSLPLDLNSTNTSNIEDSSSTDDTPTEEEVYQYLTRLSEIVPRETFESARRVLEQQIIALQEDPWRDRILARIERLQHGPRISSRSNEFMRTGDAEIDLLTREIDRAERKHGMMKVLHVIFSDNQDMLDKGKEIVTSNITGGHIVQAQELLWGIYSDHKNTDFNELTDFERAILEFDIKFTANWTDLVEDLVENLPLMMFVLLPIFVSLLALLSLGKGIRVVFQLIFAMHLHAFIFITLTFCILSAMLIAKLSTAVATIFSLLITLFIVVHVYLSFKKFYGSGYIVSFLRFGFLSFVYVSLLLLSLGFMFVYFAIQY